jgi:predicted alpha/beta hydrolase family esterase
MITTFILPGIGNSGPDHWQSRWEKLHPEFVRVHQDDWDTPRCADWVRKLDEVIGFSAGSVVLVAHSSACLLVAHWATKASPARIQNVRGALLVGPSDPDGPNYPVGPTGFTPVPLLKLPFPSIVVASTDDRYVTIDRAREFAAAWQSRIVSLGNKGHINAESNLGDWPQGLELLRSLQEPS